MINDDDNDYSNNQPQKHMLSVGLCQDAQVQNKRRKMQPAALKIDNKTGVNLGS